MTIVVGQLKDFFGVTFRNTPIETVEKMEEFISCFDTVNLWALVVGWYRPGDPDRLAPLFLSGCPHLWWR